MSCSPAHSHLPPSHPNPALLHRQLGLVQLAARSGRASQPAAALPSLGQCQWLPCLCQQDVLTSHVRRTCVMVPLLSFPFCQTLDHGQKTFTPGPERSLVKELSHFLRVDQVESPVEGTGRIWEGGRELVRIHHPKCPLQDRVLAPLGLDRPPLSPGSTCCSTSAAACAHRPAPSARRHVRVPWARPLPVSSYHPGTAPPHGTRPPPPGAGDPPGRPGHPQLCALRGQR